MSDAERTVGRIVFLSQHVLDSDRRAGFHWLADAFWRAGWHVTFVTTAISFVSTLRRDIRLGSNHPWGEPIEIAPRLIKYIEPALIHPFRVDVPLVGTAAEVLMSAYGRILSAQLRLLLADADIVVFESNGSLLMFDAVRRATAARLVYRVSDDVRVIRNSRLVHRAETAALPYFNCISVPSRLLLERRFAGLERAVFHPQGVRLPSLGANDERLFSGPGPHAVALGNTLLDYKFLRLAPARRPDITFHQIGRARSTTTAPNLVYHGELSFDQAVAYAAQSDVCLALYEDRPTNDYLAETSNKLTVYRSLRKPIVAPAFLQRSLRRPGTFFYDIKTPASIDAALDAALSFDPANIPDVKHSSWDDIRDGLLEDLELLSTEWRRTSREARYSGGRRNRI